MMRLILIGIAAGVTAACENATAPTESNNVSLLPNASVVSVTDRFSTQASLSNPLVVEGSPVTYGVNFGFGFSSISQVEYDFTFVHDLLDPGECLFFRGGFCNPGATAQASRLLTIPCSGDPGTCNLFRDGADTRQLTAGTVFGSGPASVRIRSLRVTVQGIRAECVRPGGTPHGHCGAP